MPIAPDGRYGSKADMQEDQPPTCNVRCLFYNPWTEIAARRNDAVLCKLARNRPGGASSPATPPALARIERDGVRLGEARESRKSRDHVFFDRRNVAPLSPVIRPCCTAARPLCSGGTHRSGACISPDIYRTPRCNIIWAAGRAIGLVSGCTPGRSRCIFPVFAARLRRSTVSAPMPSQRLVERGGGPAEEHLYWTYAKVSAAE
jgi:hypothetical protein